MSILVDGETAVLVQGITGASGRLHAKACREYGTRVVAGVTPGKGGAERVIAALAGRRPDEDDEERPVSGSECGVHGGGED